MKKLSAILICCALLISIGNIDVFAKSKSHDGITNYGDAYHMSYSITNSRATCGITCSSAHSVQAFALVTYNNGANQFVTIMNNVDPGTSAFTAWNAHDGEFCISSYAKGYVNDALVYADYILP